MAANSAATHAPWPEALVWAADDKWNLAPSVAGLPHHGEYGKDEIFATLRTISAPSPPAHAGTLEQNIGHYIASLQPKQKKTPHSNHHHQHSQARNLSQFAPGHRLL
jgi:hypothetical protein